jgi:penicillin-binding protein 1C
MQSVTREDRKRLPPARRRWAVAALAMTALAGFAGLLLYGAVLNAPLDAPQATEIVYDRNGAFLTQVAHGPESLGYGYWPLEKIPERLVLATLALEDRRFYEHPGVDPLAVARAAWRNLMRRGPRQGGSTIAMQVARMQRPNMQRSKPRGLISKLEEATTALALVARHGREAVLLHYLRLAPHGAGSHGAAHAARFYFDKPVEDLSWAETALLAAVPQAPGRMNLARESGMKRAATRAAHAIDALARQGTLDREQAALAKAQLRAMRPIETPKRPQALHLALRYAQLLRDGRIEAEPHDPRIHASIDLDVETRIARLARRYLDGFRDAGARQVAIMVAERKDGNRIVAEVGSARFGGENAGSFDFTRAARSPGSTLKPFVYALAFERDALEFPRARPESTTPMGSISGR